MVTVWIPLQFVGVNVRLAGETVPSEVSELLTAIVTSAVGSLIRLIVKVACPPSSVVLPLIFPTVTPATSLSILITDTSSGFKPL